jgi:hypothetical protein
MMVINISTQEVPNFQIKINKNQSLKNLMISLMRLERIRLLSKLEIRNKIDLLSLLNKNMEPTS